MDHSQGYGTFGLINWGWGWAKEEGTEQGKDPGWEEVETDLDYPHKSRSSCRSAAPASSPSMQSGHSLRRQIWLKGPNLQLELAHDCWPLWKPHRLHSHESWGFTLHPWKLAWSNESADFRPSILIISTGETKGVPGINTVSAASIERGEVGDECPTWFGTRTDSQPDHSQASVPCLDWIKGLCTHFLYVATFGWIKLICSSSLSLPWSTELGGFCYIAEILGFVILLRPNPPLGGNYNHETWVLEMLGTDGEGGKLALLFDLVGASLEEPGTSAASLAHLGQSVDDPPGITGFSPVTSSGGPGSSQTSTKSLFTWSITLPIV